MSKFKPYDQEPFIHEIYDKKDWDDNDLKYHRMDIADYLYYINEGKCFYCKCEINKNSSKEHIEHIIDKSDYDQFTYQPKNLTLACENCNTTKSIKSVLNRDINSDCSYDDYPLNSNDYKIIHAYIDIYEECIKPGIIYEPIDNKRKGENTILMCGINHSIRVEQRQRMCDKKRKISSLISSQLDNKSIKIEASKIIDNLLDGNIGKNDNFEYIRGTKVLYYFLEELVSDRTRLKNGTIDKIKILDDEIVSKFNKYYKLIDSIIKSNDKKIICGNLDDTLQKYEIYENINSILDILNIVYSLNKKKTYSSAIRFILDIEHYNKILQKYISDNTLKVELISSLKYVLQIYNNYFVDDDKIIDKDKIKMKIKICEIIREIKEEEYSYNEK